MTIQTEININTALNFELMAHETPSDELMSLGICLYNYALLKEKGCGTIYYDENTIYARQPEKFNPTSWCTYEDCAFAEINEQLFEHFAYLVEEEYGSRYIYEADGSRGTYYTTYHSKLDDYDMEECFGSDGAELVSLTEIVENLFGEEVVKFFKIGNGDVS